MKQFNKTERDPDFASSIYPLFQYLNEDNQIVLREIHKAYKDGSINKNRAIFRYLSELSELFVKINNAITLDFIHKWGLIVNRDIYDNYPQFTNVLGFDSEDESMNTYKMFIK